MEWIELLKEFILLLAKITDKKEELNITPEQMIIGALALIVIAAVIIFWGKLKKGAEIVAIIIAAMAAIIAPFMDLISPWWTVVILIVLFVIAFRNYFGWAVRITAIGLLSIFLVCTVLVMMFSEPLQESLDGGLQAYEKYQQGEAAVDYLETTAEGLQEHPIETGKQVLGDLKGAWNSFWNKNNED